VLLPTLVDLALALSLAAAPTPVPLGDPPGRVALLLDVALQLDTAAAQGALPLTWRSEPDGATPEAEALVRLSPQAGGAWRVEVELRWRREAGLRRAGLRLGWPGEGAGAIGRDLAAASLARPLRTGRGTPLLAWAGPALLVGGPGVVAASLTGRPGLGQRPGGLDATLWLDEAAERPFATYQACLEQLPHLDGLSGHGWADLEKKHEWLEAPRRPGEVDRLSATLYPRQAPWAGPLVPARWPRGARAAVVLTDHADRTEAPALRAVLFGTSDRRALGGVGAGVLGRGLALTRTFFVTGGAGTLEDPETAELARWLIARGSEVGLHSVTDGRDDRVAVLAGLLAAAPYRPAVWIDHEPYVNCEALSAQGAGLDGPYGVRDLLVAGGIRWGWAAGDVAGFRTVEVADLFAAAPPDRPSPVVYPLPADPRLWIFETSFFYAPPAALAAALSDEALDRLERGEGLFAGHTYLAAGPGLTHGAEATGRLAVRPAPPPAEAGLLEIDPDLDAALARLARHVERGTLASLTWSDAGDRLRALGDVEITYRPDGSAAVANRGPLDLPGFTLLVPAEPGRVWWVDGRPAAGLAAGGRIWFDLPAGAVRQVRATSRLEPATLWPGGHG